MTLRDYQVNAIANLRAEIAQKKRRVMLSSATGSGKSRIMVEMAQAAARKGKRVVVLCDRIQLVQQMSGHFTAIGLHHGIIQADNSRAEYSPVIVASIQTVTTRGLPEGTDLVLIDEAHGCGGREEFRKVIQRAMSGPKTVVIGFSATPWSKGLAKHYEELGGPLFESMVTTVSIEGLIEQGFLVDADVYAPYDPDLSGVKTVAGDYNEKQLGAAMNKPNMVGDIVTHWLKLANGLPTVCFATNILHSQSIASEFVKCGIAAEHISCKTPDAERLEILARVASGETKVICNAMLLTTGWDFPACRCMILARPTKSLVTYVQMVGRILRPHDNISVLYRSYMENRDVCRGDEMDAGRQAGQHGGRGHGVEVWRGEAIGIPALEREESGLFFAQGARLPAVQRTREGAQGAWKLHDGCDTQEAVQRSQAGGDCVDTEPGKSASGQPQGRRQAEQHVRKLGVGDEPRKHDSCAPAWLVPGKSARRLARDEQASGVAGSGDQAGAEVISSWSIDGTGKKIRCTQDDDKRDQGWQVLGACFVADDAADARHLARVLCRIHQGEEALLVVEDGADTGAARRIVGVEIKKTALVLDHSGTCQRLGFPTDDRSDIPMCDGKPKAGSDAKEKEKIEALPKVCPACSFLKPAKTPICPACGHQSQKPTDIVMEEGELVLVQKSKKHKAEDPALRFGPKQHLWSMLLGYAEERGWPRGAASHKFKGITGAWPRLVADIACAPSPELRSWLKADQIRYMHAKKAAELRA
jgi:superfamily II DNA or RNA helicase